RPTVVFETFFFFGPSSGASARRPIPSSGPVMGSDQRRIIVGWIAMVALVLGALGALRLLIERKPETGFPQNGSSNPTPEAQQATASTVQRRRSLPVDLNQGSQIPRGFRGGGFQGDAHPLLRAGPEVRVVARWTKVGKGLDKLDESVPPGVYRLFLDLKPAEPERTYPAADFSAFLPEEIQDPGQTWALDEARALHFLTQFHAQPSLELVASGRRGGPNGAFAVLRATSDRYLDVVFRIHAEFDLKPKVWKSAVPLEGVWFTPAFLE